ALKTAQEGRAALESAVGKFHPQLYFLHMLEGDIHWKAKNFGEAEKSLKEALKQAESRQHVAVNEWTGAETEFHVYRSQPNEAGMIHANVILGTMMVEQQRVKEGEPYFKAALKMAEQQYGKKSLMVAGPLYGLAKPHF